MCHVSMELVFSCLKYFCQLLVKDSEIKFSLCVGVLYKQFDIPMLALSLHELKIVINIKIVK